MYSTNYVVWVRGLGVGWGGVGGGSEGQVEVCLWVSGLCEVVWVVGGVGGWGRWRGGRLGKVEGWEVLGGVIT